MVNRKPVPALRYFDPFRESQAFVPLAEDESRILQTVNQQIAAKRSLTDLIDFLFERTGTIFPFDRIGLSFVEEDGRRIVSQYARASYAPVLLGKGYAEDLQASSLERVLKAGTPRIIDDLERYLDEHPHSRSTRLLVREGVRSSLTCPLVVEGRVVGFLFRSSRQRNVYTARHVELEMAISERLSQAVEKAWRIEQLEAVNFAYMEMLGFVSHELKNPVASMVTDAKLLSEGYLGPLEQPQTDKLRRLIDKGEHLLDLVAEYLDLARVEGGELRLTAAPDVIFVDEVVEPALDVFRDRIAERGMQLVLDIPNAQNLVADCDPALLKIVLVNLLGNAVKYGRDGGGVRLTVTMESAKLKVAVWNEGQGFKSGDRPKLFRKFSRLATPAHGGRGGTGLGLYNVWRIIQLHGGRIKADSKYGEWAIFTFEIPQPLPKAATSATE
jgi:signal transduction histidine kinase